MIKSLVLTLAVLGSVVCAAHAAGTEDNTAAADAQVVEEVPAAETPKAAE